MASQKYVYKVVEQIPGEQYDVVKMKPTQEVVTTYSVKTGKSTWTCSCIGNSEFGVQCKHFTIVENFGVEHSEQRIPVREADAKIKPLLALLSKLWKRYEICGSYRRGRSNVKDIDVVVIGDIALTRRVLQDACIPVDVGKHGSSILRFRWKGIPIDLLFTTKASWGASVLYMTGPWEYNRVLRFIASRKGLLLNRWGLWRGETQVAGATEEAIYKAMGEPFRTPAMRDRYRSELDAAKRSI